jgi:hypothetical protein
MNEHRHFQLAIPAHEHTDASSDSRFSDSDPIGRRWALGYTSFGGRAYLKSNRLATAPDVLSDNGPFASQPRRLL